jgi:hypothetical protein
MEPLDELSPPAADLLARVDDLLGRVGAPEQHPVWPLLRRVRVLPGEAVAGVAALRPAPLAATGAAVRTLAGGYADASATLARATGGWEGPAAEAYAAHRGDLRARVDVAGQRLVAVAERVDAAASWVYAARQRLSVALAEVLGSAEAVAVVRGDADAPVAAADIAARVLGAVDELAADADRLGFDERGALPVRRRRPPPVPPSVPPPVPPDATTRVDL